MNIMDEITGDSLALGKDSISYKETVIFELSRSSSEEVQSPLLPRSGWQDRRTFLSVIMRAKRSLDIAVDEHPSSVEAACIKKIVSLIERLCIVVQSLHPLIYSYSVSIG